MFLSTRENDLDLGLGVFMVGVRLCPRHSEVSSEKLKTNGKFSFRPALFELLSFIIPFTENRFCNVSTRYMAVYFISIV